MRSIITIAVFCSIVGCGSRSTDRWLNQLKDSDVVKRREAIRELGAKPSESHRLIPALTEMLKDENHYVRHDAALTLGKFGDRAQASVPALLVAFNDSEKNVRIAAAASLKKIAPEAAGLAAKP